MTDIIFDVVKILIAAILFLFAKYLIPYLKYKYASTVVGDAVAAMEQTIKESGMGSIKKEKVVSYAKKVIGNMLTDEQIDALIEAAVFALKRSK